VNIVILDWMPRTSGTLRGHLSLRLASGLVLHEVSVHTRDGNWWLAMPARPMLQDGAALRDAAGKVRYAPPVVAFANPEIRSRFTAQVLEALRQAQPELFAAEAVA
jgi:DNA-binding cell septation regulator SpoVG